MNAADGTQSSQGGDRLPDPPTDAPLQLLHEVARIERLLTELATELTGRPVTVKYDWGRL